MKSLLSGLNKMVLDQCLARGIHPESLATDYYAVAFLHNDNEGMQKQVSLALGKPGYEDQLLSAQADTDGYHGRLKQAREYSQRAVESAQRNGTGEVAAGWAASQAFREAEVGNASLALRSAALTSSLSQDGPIGKTPGGILTGTRHVRLGVKEIARRDENQERTEPVGWFHTLVSYSKI